MCLFQLASIVALAAGLFWTVPAGKIAFGVIPIAVAIFGYFNRKACQGRIHANLEVLGFSPLGAQQDHLLKYANFYSFPMTCTNISRFFSTVYFLAFIGVIGFVVRWLGGGEKDWLMLASSIISVVVASGQQVQYNPPMFFSGQLQRDPTYSNPITFRAAIDLDSHQILVRTLAEYPQIIGGNDHWKIVMEIHNEESV